ncbi:hypothetical protein [Dissulfurimicrobium hydrothermale]|uniref:hypothetical protein n=1 Tax=Dissulfurimicrobium hydrothermale TaxID=1750598 RepID=UPI001EDB0E95|nr:hypothetical protein [Dissulfurimicrobium hydrothermale]UKL13846.1 hypothetical protein LGS26_00825 [Dissulfurimicrobium hydrothermale]
MNIQHLAKGLVVGMVVVAMFALSGCGDSGQKKEAQEKASSKVQPAGVSQPQDVVKKNLTQFEDLLKATKCYIDKGLDVKELYPLTAESADCLDKGYGGYERPAPNYNWTHQDGWLGMWGNKNQIGVGLSGSFEEIKPVLERYKADVREIFFPYPTKYEPNKAIPSDTKGLLLMVFPKEFVMGAEGKK